jgi:hypothetical protein
MMRFATALLCACALGACSKPEPPEKDRPPEPQAQAKAAPARPYGNPHAMRDAIQAPIERAKSAEDVTLEAARKQQAAIDAQMAGQEPAPATTGP